MKNIPLKRFVGALIVTLLVLPIVSFKNIPDPPAYAIKTIVIDAGHGGKFPGARGKISREEEVALTIALRLGKAIEENMKDVKVIYTRTSNKELAPVKAVDLRKRIEMANRVNADLLISIHLNAHTPNAKGVETFVAGFDRLDEQEEAIGEHALLKDDYKEDAKLDITDPETAIALSLVAGDLRKKSIQLATLIQDEYVAAGRVNRGVQELSLAVLRTAIMPSVLTEIGFISNREEEKYMLSEAGQNEIVNCLLKAIQAYKKQAEAE